LFPPVQLKMFLSNPTLMEKRSKWIARLIEFDVEIKPTKLVKGQGLAKLLAEENCRLLEINLVSINAENDQSSENKEGKKM
jgi:hypothetical protein